MRARSLLGLFLLEVCVGSAAASEEQPLAHMSIEELMDVSLVSSVSLIEETLTETPASVTVLTREDFERYQFDSVADALTFVAGFDVLYDLSSHNVGVRGISGGWGGESNVVKVTIDGQDSSYRPTNGVFVGPELIPPQAIERVEFVRGPLSAIYGANAFLGLVNVVPRAVDDGPPGASASAAYLNHWGEHGLAADLAAWARPFGVEIFAAASLRSLSRDGLELPTSSPRHDDLIASGAPAETRDDDDLTVSSYLRVAHASPRFGQLSLDGQVRYYDRTANFSPHSESMQGARLALSSSAVRLRYRRGLGGGFDVDASTSLSSGGPTRAERLYDPYRSGVDHLRREQSYLATGSALTFGYRRESLYLKLGADYATDHEELPTLVIVRTSGEVVRENAGRELDVDNLGMFVHLAWQTRPWLRLAGGLRYESHSLFGAQLSYRASAVLGLSRDTALKALVGSSFHAPSPMLMFGGSHPRLFGPVPNAQLEPEYALTTELVLATRLGETVRADAGIYYTRLQDLVELDTVAASPRARNRAEIDAAGGEVDVRLRWPDLGLDGFANAGYVFTQVTQDVPASIEVSEQSRLYPAFAASAGLSHGLTAAPLRFFLLGKWTGERAADKSNLPFLAAGERKEYFLPSYLLVDVGAASVDLHLAGRPFRATLKVRNLLDHRHVEPGFSGVDVSGLRRQIYLGVEGTL